MEKQKVTFLHNISVSSNNSCNFAHRNHKYEKRKWASSLVLTLASAQQR